MVARQEWSAPRCKEIEICSEGGSPSLLMQQSLGLCQLLVTFITLTSFLLVDAQWRESYRIWPCQMGHCRLEQGLLSQKPDEGLPFHQFVWFRVFAEPRPELPLPQVKGQRLHEHWPKTFPFLTILIHPLHSRKDRASSC